VTSARLDVARTTGWVDAGDAVLSRVVGELTDADLDAPTRLDGWSRRHVIAHLARNAEALRRLLAWARTGIVSPMYADTSQRAAEIERSADHEPARLRSELEQTAAALRDDAAAMTDEAWSARVRSARGREIPAAEVLWMRAREVWLHALDLNAGVGIADLPTDFSVTLVEDVVGFFATVPACPAMRIVSSGHTWALGAASLAGAAGAAALVRGEPQYVAAWLTGRSTGEGLPVDRPPKPPAWL
jgi:maleylpyruvate isomerase